MQVDMYTGTNKELQTSSASPVSMAAAVSAEGAQAADFVKGKESSVQDLGSDEAEEAGWSSGFEDSDDDMFGGPF